MAWQKRGCLPLDENPDNEQRKTTDFILGNKQTVFSFIF